jgi:3-oxoacyl-[acyl-carrier-protein] synthase III
LPMADVERNAYIAGLGSYVPPKVMTNEDFERILDTSDEWITQMTGIKERHFVEGDVATSDLAAEACRQALDEAGVEPSDVDMMVVATATPDMLFPSTACLTQAKIGASNAFAFDLSAGCTGFLYALVVATQFVRAGGAENVLVVGAEVLSRFADMTDRATCVLFGDGAGAALVRPCGPDRGMLQHYLGSDGSLARLLEMPGGGSRRPPSKETIEEGLHYIRMQGRKVYVNAVRAMGDSIVKVIEDAGFEGKDVDILFPHQANIRIIQSVAERAQMPMEKVFVNIHKYGNTSAASIPIALKEAAGTGVLTEGKLIGMVAFGAGFTWGAALMRW